MNRWTTLGTLGSLSLVLFMAGILDGCRPNKQPDSLTGNVTEAPSAASDSSGHAVTIESGDRSVEISEAVEQWPTGAPAEVPRYPYGTIRKIIRSETPEGNSWDMAIDGLPEHAIREYEAMLKASGFKTTSLIVPAQDGERGSVTGEKGLVTVVLIGSGSSANLSIIQKF
ncbi:MAG: hypothetical protein HGA97_09105 [Chlorobiaceae bacterium]|nr:hypothetical protein [Chlorobiaceae bacterium]